MTVLTLDSLPHQMLIYKVQCTAIIMADAAGKQELAINVVAGFEVWILSLVEWGTQIR